jgi:hypothetical protein
MRMILCLALGVIFGCSVRAALARDVGAIGNRRSSNPGMVSKLDAAGHAIIIMLR